MNILDDFYLPLLDQEKHYLSKEYKLLKKNKIDTAEFDGLEKDKNAGEITFTEANEDQKKELYNEVLDFVAAIPKDLLISITRGGLNGFDFVKDLVAFTTYGNEQLPDDSVFKFIDDRIEAQKKNLNELEKDDPLTTRMIGALGQDAAFVLPIYKKMKSVGIPKQFSLPASFAIGSTLAFDKETSFMLDTEMIKGLKDTINLNEDTPAEELFDKAVQGIEFTGLGYAFNKLYPMIKAMRKINPKKAAIVTGGTAAAGAAVDAITNEAEGAVPPKVIKTLAEEGVKKLKSVTSTKSDELIDQIIKGEQDIKVLDIWKPNTPEKIKNEFYSIQGLDKMTIDQNTRGADIINKYLKEDRSGKFVDYVENNFSDQDFNKIMKKFGFDDEVLPID
tara:strand:- start:81 stop:1250 length:1170 start_codon:yes stop_codon:yes gene_type:complete